MFSLVVMMLIGVNIVVPMILNILLKNRRKSILKRIDGINVL